MHERRRSAFKPSDASLIIETQSYRGADDLLSKTEPLPERYIKENIRDPMDRKRPSQIMVNIQKRRLP